jgi:hypothetical protein
MSDVDYDLFVAKDKFFKFVDNISPALLYLFSKTFLPYTTVSTGKNYLALTAATKLVKRITRAYDTFQLLMQDTIEMSHVSVDDLDDNRKKLYTFTFIKRKQLLEHKLMNIFNDIASFESVINFNEEDFVDEEE